MNILQIFQFNKLMKLMMVNKNMKKMKYNKIMKIKMKILLKEILIRKKKNRQKKNNHNYQLKSMFQNLMRMKKEKIMWMYPIYYKTHLKMKIKKKNNKVNKMKKNNHKKIEYIFLPIFYSIIIYRYVYLNTFFIF